MYFKNKLLKKRNGNNFKRAKLNFDKHSLTINVLLIKRIIFERKFYLNAKNIKKTQRNQSGYCKYNIRDFIFHQDVTKKSCNTL